MANEQVNKKVVTINDQPIFKTADTILKDETSLILDKDWTARAFLVPDSTFSKYADIQNRYWTSASGKFTDTRIGGNIGINSRPQYCPYADIRSLGRMSGRNKVTVTNTIGNLGMGRHYAEFDDNCQTVYIRYGVTKFNSLTDFLTSAFDPDMTSMARTGRTTSAFYKLGNVLGTIGAVAAVPGIAVFVFGMRTVNAIFRRPMHKFCMLKPTMHSYWSAVQTLSEAWLINRGILPKVFAEEDKQQIGQPFKINTEYLEYLSDLMPGILSKDNWIDVYAVSNRAQRMANQLFADDYEKLNNGSATDFVGYVSKVLTGHGTHSTYISTGETDSTLNKFLNFVTDKKENSTLAAYLTQAMSMADYKTEEVTSATELDSRSLPDKETWITQWQKHFDAEWRDGSAFAVFKVDDTKQVQESFGTSVQESDISQKLNGISSQIKQARFSFADGNIFGDGIMGLVQDVVGAAGDVASGMLSGASFGWSNVIKGLGGSGYIDIPKHWQSSSANLPKSSYTMQLISPYGNPISQFQNIYLPLFMLLAGILPLATGKASYTSPFCCQLFDRGRQQIRYGMMESLSITRGTSNLSFDNKGNALAIDVQWSVVDLSSIMHMPITAKLTDGPNMTIDEDNVLADYLAVLAGQDMYSQIYALPKAKLAAAKLITQYKRYTSPAYMNMAIHEAMSGTPMGAIYEGLVRGSDIIKQG